MIKEVVLLTHIFYVDLFLANRTFTNVAARRLHWCANSSWTFPHFLHFLHRQTVAGSPPSECAGGRPLTRSFCVAIQPKPSCRARRGFSWRQDVGQVLHFVHPEPIFRSCHVLWPREGHAVHRRRLIDPNLPECCPAVRPKIIPH